MFGRSPVWIDTIEPDEVEGKLLYALKGQVKEYRARHSPGHRIDRETGEITANVRQSKRWMRTRNHVRMIEALDGLNLDKLIFGNAAGTQVARAIRYEALKPFCRLASRANRTAELAGRPVPYPIVNTHRAVGLRLQRELGMDFMTSGAG